MIISTLLSREKRGTFLGITSSWFILSSVKLGHTPGVLDDTVADLVVGLMLSTSRRLVEVNLMKIYHDNNYSGDA